MILVQQFDGLMHIHPLPPSPELVYVSTCGCVLPGSYVPVRTRLDLCSEKSLPYRRRKVESNIGLSF